MMIEIPVHNAQGQPVEALQIEEGWLGGEVRPALLKQAYVRYHANQRQGSAKTRNRSEVAGSTRKLHRQKGTGNARRGDRKANILRGGGRAFAKRPRSWRQGLPHKMRRLANRNAVLAKAIDSQIKLIDVFAFEQPSTPQFVQLLDALQIDRSCLLALASTRGHEARSARNLNRLSITQIDRINTYMLLNHHYLLADKASLQGWIDRARAQSRRAAGSGEDS